MAGEQGTLHRRTRSPGVLDARVDTNIPSSIAGLQLWLKADAITGVANGAALATWPDSSGNGRNATQGTAANRPIYNTNQINGLPAVSFDATNDGMVTTWVVSSGSLTLLVLLRATLTSGNHRAVQGTANWHIGPYQTLYRYFNGVLMAGHAIVAGAWTYMGATQTTGLGILYVNGTPVASNGSSGLPSTVTLGGSGLFNEPLAGDIAEVIGFNRVITNDERSAIHQYIRKKYALT